MEFSKLLGRVRIFADVKLREGSNIMEVAALFRDQVLPKQFVEDDPDAVKRASQMVITEYQTGRVCKNTKKGHVCLPIGRDSIDNVLFGFDD